MECQTQRLQDQVAELQERMEIMYQCVDDIMGHGVTLPMAGNYSDEYSRGYARGVDSQRGIAREALKALAALGDSR